ncbi:MAG: type VI secretion system membrane subunit TssM, partial [Nannocystaceae bacterium]
MTHFILAICLVAPWVLAILGWLSFVVAAAICLVVILLVLGLLVFRRIAAVRAARRLEVAIFDHAKTQDEGASPDIQLQLEELRKGFMQAIRELKGSNLAGGGRRALYALPWYVVIGPPGAGKTTAIGRSGLNFPLRRSQSALRGIGGTRNCEWWLANEAVLIDTAGRYTTGSEDREEWLEFLSLLRTHRRRKPINGVLVTIGVDEIYQRDEESLQRHSRRIRARVDEIQRHLGIIVPVYLVFTKCDLLPGFSEMYAELDRTAREEPLGLEISDADGELRNLEKNFARLVDRVSQGSLLRLLETPNPATRDQVHRYGGNFREFLTTIQAFVQATFASTVYEETPRLRGVYFTSALQEGSPIDRAGDALARAFGVNTPCRAASAPQRVYFLAKLFPERIFPEAGLTIQSPHQQGRRKKFYMALAGGLCGLGCLSVLLGGFALQA